MREAYETNVRLGVLAGRSETLGYAEVALVLAGDPDASEIQFAKRHGERVHRRQLHLVEATIARARREPSRAPASVRCAVAEAQAQEPPWLELLTLVEPCGRGGSTAEDHRHLVARLDELPEATGTSACARACALLEGTKPS